MSGPLEAWTQEPELVDEQTFTPHAEPGFHAWNAMSAELEFCQWVAEQVIERRPQIIIECGVGQGFTTRRIIEAMDDTQVLWGYESGDEWRHALGTLNVWNDQVILANVPSPSDVDLAKADLLIFDSDVQFRVDEFTRWLDHGKPGSMAICHDTGNGHPETHFHSKWGQFIRQQEIGGEFRDNPRGSWFGVMPEGYRRPDLEAGGRLNTNVAVGTIYPGEVRGEYAFSMLHTALRNPEYIRATILRQSGPMIQTTRNMVTKDFLMKTDAEWLWWVDADMQWEEDALERLLEAADPILRPVIGGLCFGKSRDGTVFPTMYRLDDTGAGFNRAEAFTPGDVIEVDATGTAFLLVHRSVLEAFEGHYHDPYKYFSFTEWDGRAVGEDITFCLRIRERGFPIYVHTGVQVGHIKHYDMNFDEHMRWKRENRAVIVGSGRCGTNFVSQLLSRMDHYVAHEQVFNAKSDPDWGMFRADASWMAVPHLPKLVEQDVKVVHLVRDPIEVVKSMMGMHLFDPEYADLHEPITSFLREHWDGWQSDGTVLENTLNFIVDWNEQIETYDNYFVRVEDLKDPQEIQDLLKYMGSGRELGTIRKIAAKAPERTNSRPRDETITWNTLPDSSGAVRLREMAERYGYKTDDSPMLNRL